jgi:hypothetical protein
MKNLEFERLPEVVQRNHTTYTLLERTNLRTTIKNEGIVDKALYISNKEDHGVEFYEVFKIRITKANTFQGIEYPDRETYPSTEHFGIMAWCTRIKEEAYRIYNDLDVYVEEEVVEGVVEEI